MINKFEFTSDEEYNEYVLKLLEMVGKQYQHYKGGVYTVLVITNIGDPQRLKKHPIDIVYMSQKGEVFSRPLSDWNDKFRKILKHV